MDGGAEWCREQGFLPHDGGVFSYLFWKFGMCCEGLEIRELRLKSVFAAHTGAMIDDLLLRCSA